MADLTQLSSLLWELLCAAGLLFWPVEVIMVGFFTGATLSQIIAHGSLKRSGGSHPPPNRLATTFPEFHNLKGIPQEKSYIFVSQWWDGLEPPYQLPASCWDFHS